ncbi:MAG: hypothetical protein P4L70_01665, partial [Parasulfuritortus sp.]|nr:hypothetical protein [Parasulfuritortus sp.]
MYNDDDLDSAVEAGAITAEAVEAFRRHVATLRMTPAVDEEYFRLVSGFNDIFVVVASGLLLLALGSLGQAIQPWVGSLLVAAAAWGLAEYFVRRRHMALPAIVLLLAFVAGVFFLFKTLLPDGLVILASGATAVAAFLHWRRFHVPISVAAGALATVGSVLIALLAVLPSLRDGFLPFVFVAGLLVFLLALRWDTSDIARQTRRSDVAFWLHLLAAPLLVHPVFAGMRMLTDVPDLLGAAAILALYLVVAVVSLWIDRRALMVSALGYVLFAFTQLLKDSGFVSLGFAVT